jgi:periplasmic protein TonB
MHSPLFVALLIAVVLHVVGLATAAHVWRGLGVFLVSPPSMPIVARIVPVELPSAPVLLPEPALNSPPPPDLQPVTPPVLELPAPPPLVEKTMLKPPELPPEPALVPKAPKVKKPAAAGASPRSPRPPTPDGTSLTQRPKPGPPLPQSVEQPETSRGNVLGAPPTVPRHDKPPEPIEGREAGAGKLFDRGEMAMVPGPEISGGSGGTGSTGSGLGATGSGPKEGGVQAGGGGEGAGGVGAGRGSRSGNGDSNGGAVRPLGGYQVKPRYPEAARRRGVEGTVLLKVRVADTGRVETVQVERSAGHLELDQSAAEAVQRWRFEPARRSGTPIAVWVLIPVEFRLDNSQF